MAAGTSTRWFPAVLAVITFTALVSGCGSPAAPTPVLETETFTGTLDVQGFDSRTFDVVYASTATDASITLTSLVTVADGTAINTTVGLGFGEPAASGACNLRASHTTPTAQLNQELIASGIFAPGTYCVGIFDAGTLTEPLTYTLIVRHF